MNIAKMTLKEVIEISEPYDVTHLKGTFLDEISLNPDLQKQYERRITKQFADAAAKKGVFFITNAVSGKHPYGYESNIKLSFVGPENSPTISLNY